MNDEKPKPKRNIKKKRIGQFEDASGTVRVWYDVKNDELCFKRAGRSRTNRISLPDVYDKAIGQMALPLKTKQ